MKIAVTGASGHVGNVLCRELIRRGYTVKALIHKNEDDLQEIGADVFRGDVTDKESLVPLLKDTDMVFHLAARISIDSKNKDLIYSTNVEGTQNVIDLSVEQKVGKIIHFSSIHTLKINAPSSLLDESNPIVDDSPMYYEQTKAEAERRVLRAFDNGLTGVVLNPTAIFGPYDYKPSFLGQALIKMALNKLPMLVSGGYNFVDVRDVVSGAIAAALNGKAGEKYILSGHWYSLKELSELIHRITKNKTPRIVAPDFIARAGLPFITLYSKISGSHPLYTSESLEILKNSSRNISSRKANKLLGYKPRPIEESLKDTFEWFRNNHLM